MDTKQFELIKEARQQKYIENCRKRLSDIAEKKIKTTLLQKLFMLRILFVLLLVVC